MAYDAYQRMRALCAVYWEDYVASKERQAALASRELEMKAASLRALCESQELLARVDRQLRSERVSPLTCG